MSIDEPKFMKDESLYTIDEKEGIILTDKGMKDKEVVKEFIKFKIELQRNTEEV